MPTMATRNSWGAAILHLWPRRSTIIVRLAPTSPTHAHRSAMDPPPATPTDARHSPLGMLLCARRPSPAAGDGGDGGDSPPPPLRVAAHRAGHRRVSTLKLLPSRFLSRLYGAVNRLPLPNTLRPLVYGAWAWTFRVKLEEVPRPLASYVSLTAFFTRRLREGCRPVHPSAPLVSPVDGRVVALSSDVGATGTLAQVKQITYHAVDFLGLPALPVVAAGNALHSAVLYLSPGDYHRFHAPTEVRFTTRVHIAGQLLPVNPLVAALLPSLFVANERVVLLGSWAHGFFTYTAVGATNVGSIKLAFDAELATNRAAHDWATAFAPLDVLALGRHGPHGKPGTTHAREYAPPVVLARGDDVGLFELGSTVVLLFEAPALFQWGVSPGDPVVMGMPLGGLPGGAEGESVAQQQLASATALSEALLASFDDAAGVGAPGAGEGGAPDDGGGGGLLREGAEDDAEDAEGEEDEGGGRGDAGSDTVDSPSAVGAPTSVHTSTTAAEAAAEQQQQQLWRRVLRTTRELLPAPHDCCGGAPPEGGPACSSRWRDGESESPLPPPSPTTASHAAALGLLVHVHAAALAGAVAPLAARATTSSSGSSGGSACAATATAAREARAARAGAVVDAVDTDEDEFRSCTISSSNESSEVEPTSRPGATAAVARMRPEGLGLDAARG